MTKMYQWINDKLITHKQTNTLALGRLWLERQPCASVANAKAPIFETENCSRSYLTYFVGSSVEF
jgi:hypothetical protein